MRGREEMRGRGRDTRGRSARRYARGWKGGSTTPGDERGRGGRPRRRGMGAEWHPSMAEQNGTTIWPSPATTTTRRVLPLTLPYPHPPSPNRLRVSSESVPKDGGITSWRRGAPAEAPALHTNASHTPSSERYVVPVCLPRPGWVTSPGKPPSRACTRVYK